jgi:hypothetical protein
MSVFNFMETFFFISLGITFILILLLVYHFKQRLSTLEQKSDTMFDIINNVVKEMMVIKTMASANQVAIPGLASFMQTQRPLNEVFSQVHETKDISLHEPAAEVQNIYLDEDREEDDSDEESSDVGESHSDDDSNGSVSSEDEKVIISDDEDENLLSEEIEELADEGEVKVVNIEVPVEEEEPVLVNKVESQAEEEELEPVVEVSPIEEYKKLGTSALKTLVISKGLATDVSKLKKNQLLSILEKDV